MEEGEGNEISDEEGSHLESFSPPSPWATTTRHRSGHRVPLCRTWLKVSNGRNMRVTDRRGSRKRGVVNYYKNEIDFLVLPLIYLSPHVRRGS